MPIQVGAVLKALRKHYGSPAVPISSDPFGLILWEQVGYLVPDATREKAFLALQKTVGLTPAAILSAPMPTLQRITRIGGSIAAESRAARLRQSAEIVLGEWDGNLNQVLDLPLPKAKKVLVGFPTIGVPGADKILLICRAVKLLALDSNALRVCQRLGLVREGKDYRASYLAAQTALAPQLPKTFDALIAGSSLLRQHGQDLCHRNAPHCTQCPLQEGCPTGSARFGVQ